MTNSLPSVSSPLLRSSLAALTIAAFGLMMVSLSLHRGFDFADEGYLWYGSQRVLHGELPMRDFHSYDVGKYLWVALCMLCANSDSILTERIASFMFLGIGFAWSFVMLRRAKTGLNCSTAVFLACVLFFLVTCERTHIIDDTMAILLVSALTRLLGNPSTANFFLYGLINGLAATVGRQHGLYGLVAFIFSVGALNAVHGSNLFRRCIPAWVLGLAIGYSPVEFLICTSPGFFKSLIDLFIYSLRHSNLPLPLPSIVEPIFTNAHPLFRWHRFMLACLFVFLSAFDIFGMIYVVFKIWRSKLIDRPLLVSSIFLSIPYTHYAFARADGAHMVYGFLPFVVGVLILLGLDSPQKSILNVVSMALFSASLSSFVLWLHPFVGEKIQGDWRPVQGLACPISASSSTAKRTEGQIALVERYGGPEHSFLAEPFFPGLY